METGSLLVPMVLASQIAFIERWPDKNLKVSGTIKLYNIILLKTMYILVSRFNLLRLIPLIVYKVMCN